MQFQLRIVDMIMIVCIDKLLLFLPLKEGGLNIEYNLFYECKIESISFLICKCLLHNFARMLYFLYIVPIDFFCIIMMLQFLPLCFQNENNTTYIQFCNSVYQTEH